MILAGMQPLHADTLLGPAWLRELAGALVRAADTLAAGPGSEVHAIGIVEAVPWPPILDLGTERSQAIGLVRNAAAADPALRPAAIAGIRARASALLAMADGLRPFAGAAAGQAAIEAARAAARAEEHRIAADLDPAQLLTGELSAADLARRAVDRGRRALAELGDVGPLAVVAFAALLAVLWRRR